MTKRRYVINMVVVVVLAVVSGYFVGSYIAGSRLMALTNSYKELALRDISNDDAPVYFSELGEQYHASLVDAIGGKTPDKVNGISAFMMAEYNTNMSDTIYKDISGTIVAKSMGINVNQKFKSVKTKVDGAITMEKVSYSSMAKVALKVEHTIGENKYKSFKGTAQEDLSATWNTPEEIEIEQYRQSWGSGIDYFCNYLVTPKTVDSAQVSAVKQKKVSQYNDYYKETETYYEFELNLDIRIDETTGDFMYGGVSNYMYEIKNTAGADNFPVFSYCHIKVVIDSQYRLVQLDVSEAYQIIAYGFNANTTATQTELYRYQ